METAIWGLGCRPMINKPPPFKGLNIITIIIPIEGRGFMNLGSGLEGMPLRGKPPFPQSQMP